METSLARDPTHPARADEDPLARLLPRIAAGDEAAYRELYDRTSARVFGLALRVLRDRSAAEEAAIDVFAQIWRQAGRYDANKSRVMTWVTTLARTRAIDLARIQRRRTRREVAVEDGAAETLLDVQAGPWTSAVREEHAERVRGALELLPRDQRAALELAFFSGLSHSEVARQLGAPLGTVKTRIRTALSSLRTALSTVEGEL